MSVTANGKMTVAVLGAGSNGAGKIPVLRTSPCVGEILAYDIRPERVAELRSRGIAATTDLGSILGNPAVRLAFVCSSNDAHKDLTVRALEAGKAVLCEKPMATCLADAQVMVETARRCRGFLQIGFELRYSTLYVTVKEWIDRGLLGQVVNVYGTYLASAFPKGTWKTTKAGTGGMYAEKLCHYVDLPRWWVGSSVVDVTSYSAPNIIPYYEIRDNYHTTCRFANGAVGHLTFIMGAAATFAGDTSRNVVSQQLGDGHALRYLVVGTRGAAETDVFTRTIKRWEFSDSEATQVSRWVETRTWTEEEDHAYFHNVRDEVLDVVRRVHEGREPMTPADDALETTRLCEAAERSADLGRTVRMDEVKA